VRATDGVTWNPKSIEVARRGAHSGSTRAGSIARRDQYRMLISTSRGVEVRVRMFFMRKRFGERVRSASRAVVKVVVARARPMIVRNWKCQPYDSFTGFGVTSR